MFAARSLIAVFAIASSLSCTRIAHAESVYKCKGADGSVAFQDHACAHAAVESTVEILPAPPPGEAPDYGVTPRAERASKRVRNGGGAKAREVVSFECRAANGDVFYRHGACPKEIAIKSAAHSSGRRGGASKETVAVTGAALSRGEACRRMGSAGRAGRERDETVSTYDKNLGRDPCRRY